MLLDAFLAAARFSHYAALTAFFGVALFPLYAVRSGTPPPADVGLGRILIVAACAVPLTGLLWLSAAGATMTGQAGAAADPSTLWTVVSQMEFGRIWSARLALSLLALLVAILTRGALATAILAGVLLTSLALTGHARADPGGLGLVHVAADAAHLLAAGAWLGGLIPLNLLARRAAPAELAVVLRRFSAMGVAVVAVLIGSGLVNAWLLLGSLTALGTTTYGRLLAFKLALFAAMLALAAANRFWITPALAQQTDDAPRWVARLRRHVFAEQALGLAVLMVVGVLGAQAPSVTLPA